MICRYISHTEIIDLNSFPFRAAEAQPVTSQLVSYLEGRIFFFGRQRFSPLLLLACIVLVHTYICIVLRMYVFMYCTEHPHTYSYHSYIITYKPPRHPGTQAPLVSKEFKLCLTNIRG